MTVDTNSRHIALVPRDGLFCKDGRGWHTSASGRGHGLDWPWPSTILGALRTAWGRETEKTRTHPFDWVKETAGVELDRSLVLRRSVRGSGPGRFLVRDRVWPVPADALWLEGQAEVFRLRPEKPTLETLGRELLDQPTLEHAREALWVPHVPVNSKPKSPPRWWSEEIFTRWLCGESVQATPDDGAWKMTRRVQAHVGIRPETLTADDGVLFSHDVVETLEASAEWAIGAEIKLPSGTTPPLVTLGGDGRMAQVETVDAGLFAPPAKLLKEFAASGQKRIRLVVVTPAQFEQGWLPDIFKVKNGGFNGTIAGAEVDVVAAFVGRPVHISGWDMAAIGPKPTSRMVPPGSVYFLERTDGKSFGESEARDLWLKAIGERTEQGFGRVVPGIWN